MFGYLGGGGVRASKIRLGPYWFIFIYMNTNYEKKKSLFSGSWWALMHKIQRYRGHQNVGKCTPHHTHHTGFSYIYMGQNMNKNANCLLFRGPGDLQ